MYSKRNGREVWDKGINVVVKKMVNLVESEELLKKVGEKGHQLKKVPTRRTKTRTTPSLSTSRSNAFKISRANSCFQYCQLFRALEWNIEPSLKLVVFVSLRSGIIVKMLRGWSTNHTLTQHAASQVYQKRIHLRLICTVKALACLRGSYAH